MHDCKPSEFYKQIADEKLDPNYVIEEYQKVYNHAIYLSSNTLISDLRVDVISKIEYCHTFLEL